MFCLEFELQKNWQSLAIFLEHSANGTIKAESEGVLQTRTTKHMAAGCNPRVVNIRWTEANGASNECFTVGRQIGLP